MGNFLVIDNAMDRIEQIIDLLESIEGYGILLVGVHCSLEELNRRERQRQDRTIGEAAAQIHLVHRYFIYDVEVDSSAKAPSELALEIMEYVKRELARGIDDWEQRLSTALVKSSPTGLVRASQHTSEAPAADEEVKQPKIGDR